jgi:hypothetical protein
MQFDASLFVPACRRTWDIAAAMPWTVLIVALLTAAFGVLSDVAFNASPEMGSGVAIVYAMALSGIQVWITSEALECMGVKPALSIINALSIWLQSILIGLGVVLGLVLLILPGLYVAARWYLSGVILIVHGGGRRAAMRRSWDMLEARWPAVLAIAMIMFSLSAAPLMLSFYPVPFLAGHEFAVLIAINLIASIGIIGGFLAAVAVLTLIEPPTAELQEIFG